MTTENPGLHPNLKGALQDALNEAGLLGLTRWEIASILASLAHALVEAERGRDAADKWLTALAESTAQDRPPAPRLN